jgi:hypothetical protein
MSNNPAESILTEAREQRFIIEDFRPLAESDRAAVHELGRSREGRAAGAEDLRPGAGHRRGPIRPILP